MAFRAAHLDGLGVGVDFFKNPVDFLHLEVDDVIHDALRLGHMLSEQVEIKLSFRGEGVLHI